MDKQEYVNTVDSLTAEQIADGILEKIVTFQELQNTGNFDSTKQKKVKDILKKEDDSAFDKASKASKESTESALLKYLEMFPDGNHKNDAIRKIENIAKEQEVLNRIKENINRFTIDEIKSKFGENVLDGICKELKFDKKIIQEYVEPTLNFGVIPDKEADIPDGFTDVFFWGIPSSGKTCALSTILNTMSKNYTMSDPIIPKKFGARYRHNLINNIFVNEQFGYLPDSTARDRTQYMPFLLKTKGENKYRKISFFELSGEVFKYFYDIVYDAIRDDDDVQVAIGFKALDLLLNSNNQKIHFFFIDYNQETRGTRDNHGLTQSDYLQAATTYFRDRNNIFRKKTDAVYVIVTKADEIRGNNKSESAKTFLQENFSGFIDALQTGCRKDSVDFRIKMFSIGDVYFKRICKINRKYATDIINELLARVRPTSDSRIRRILNN